MLCAINSKYIHTSLSVRELYHYANDKRVQFKEFTINEKPYDIMSSIYELRCDAVLFSCYIWNIECVLEVAELLKSVSPNTQIILGGPEVSYNSVEILEKYNFIDAIMRGEGEETFKEYLASGIDIDGVTLRKNEYIVENNDREVIGDLSVLPFPYSDDDLEENKNKLIYYESSRGCPFRCSYCLSSVSHKLRLKDIEIVKKELLKFISHKVKIVKFVDRTFNADKERTVELIKFLISNASDTTFHFEVAADIINDEILSVLEHAPKGLFQFEIGIQSTNECTISAIDRKTDFNKIAMVVKKIKSMGNIHIHLDLIAGLPYEDINSFKKSFDDVFNLSPHMLQLGFLKLLHGTKIRGQKDEFEFRFTSKPPYEILSNKFLSFDDIKLLKGIDLVVDKFYNSGDFENSIKYLMRDYNSPFEFFTKLYEFYKAEGYEKVGVSKQTLYDVLYLFNKNDNLFCDILKYDFLLNNKPRIMQWNLKGYDKDLQKKRLKILNEEFIEKNLPEYIGTDARDIIKTVHFESFDYDVTGDCKKKNNVILFDKKYNKIIKLGTVK